MENIKNLTPAELANLVKTWYEANGDKRSAIMLVGEEENDGLANTQMVVGRRSSILTMFMEFLDEHANLVKEAALFSCLKRLGEELDKKENQDSKNRKS